MEKLYKEKQIGKANIFDRYFHFLLEQTRVTIMLGHDLTFSSKNYDGKTAYDIHLEGLKQYQEILEELRNEIKEMDIKDRQFLMKDSLFNNTQYTDFGFLKELSNMSKKLGTEYTQEEPNISEALLKWFYMDV